MPRISYSNYTILRNYVKQTNYERINTGRRSAQTKQPPTAMTAQELDTAYQYRQRAKREKLLRLADVNFEAGACVFVTLTFRENVQDYDTAVKSFKLFTKRLRRKLEDVRWRSSRGERTTFISCSMLLMPNSVWTMSYRYGKVESWTL